MVKNAPSLHPQSGFNWGVLSASQVEGENFRGRVLISRCVGGLLGSG